MSKNEVNYTYLNQKEINEDYLNKIGYYKDDNLTIIKNDPNSQTGKMVVESIDLVERIKDTMPEYKEIGQFLYMDVGRWGGDKDTGDDDAWTRRRNFGLVCGSGAVLCDFKNPNTSGSLIKNIDKEVEKHLDIQKMIPLLEILSGSTSLGPVTIVNALVCTDEASEAPSSDEILVFLGDIHAPVMNVHDRTYLEGMSHGRIEVTPESIAKNREIKENVTRFKKEIKVLGSESEEKEIIDLSEKIFFKYPLKRKLISEKLGNSFESQQSNNLDNSEKVKLSDATILNTLKIILEVLLLNQKIDKGYDNKKITEESASSWFKHYHGDGENKGVDIFQNAGEDLRNFLKLLMDYQKNHPKQGTIPVKLIQLGDLYDFWLGLERAFKTIDPQKMFSDSDTQSFLKFWQNETLHKTSEPISEAIDLLINGTKEFHEFVYGNHDSYRATPQWPCEIASDHFERRGIWAEHGHQSDVFNEDSNAVIGWSSALFGFFLPELREWEGPLRKEWESLISGTLCRRLTCILHAACQCQQENKRQIYVMGHTHEPLLKKVHIVE